MALQDSFVTDPFGGAAAPVHSTLSRAQTFQASADYNCTSVKLRLNRSGGSPSHTLDVSIRATTTDGGGRIPTGSDIEGLTGSINVSDISTGAHAWYEFTFSGASLTSGTHYAIVAQSTEPTGDAQPIWNAWSSNEFADGNFVNDVDADDTWASVPTWDAHFEVYGAVTSVDLSGTIAVQSAVSGNIILGDAVSLSGTIAGVSVVGPSSLGAVVVAVGVKTATIKRIVVAGNNQIWIEDI